MVEYAKVNVKLSDSQIKKLKDAVKDNTGTTLRISWKMFNGNNLPHELLLTTRQKTKVRNGKGIERAGSGNNKGKGIERAGSCRTLPFASSFNKLWNTKVL